MSKQNHSNQQQRQQQQHQQGQEQKKEFSNYARFSGIVVQMVAIIGIGTFAGVKLDEKFPNKNNWCTLILTLSAVIIAIVYTIKRIIAVSKEGN